MYVGTAVVHAPESNRRAASKFNTSRADGLREDQPVSGFVVRLGDFGDLDVADELVDDGVEEDAANTDRAAKELHRVERLAWERGVVVVVDGGVV